MSEGMVSCHLNPTGLREIGPGRGGTTVRVVFSPGGFTYLEGEMPFFLALNDLV